MKGLDDLSDVATGVPSAWNAGYNGAGIWRRRDLTAALTTAIPI